MRGRRSLQIFSRFSGFVLVSSSMLMHKIEFLVRNKRVLVNKLRHMQNQLHNIRENSKSSSLQLFAEFRQKKNPHLDPEMLNQLDHLSRIHNERIKRRRLETLHKYFWHSRWSSV
jgi:hypothetical protein